MVTKQELVERATPKSSVLAKIHMVTKLPPYAVRFQMCSVLAKIHMVTKRSL